MKRLGAILALMASAITQPFLVLAQDVIADELPRPLPISRALWTDHDGLIVAGFAALAAALLTWAVVRLLEPPPDARGLAMERIERARRLCNGGDPRAVAHEVSEAVRAYAEARFAVHAPLLSTEELLSVLAQGASPQEPWRAPLADFLVCSELARHGAAPLSRTEIDALLESARAFVLADAR